MMYVHWFENSIIIMQIIPRHYILYMFNSFISLFIFTISPFSCFIIQLSPFSYFIIKLSPFSYMYLQVLFFCCSVCMFNIKSGGFSVETNEKKEDTFYMCIVFHSVEGSDQEWSLPARLSTIFSDYMYEQNVACKILRTYKDSSVCN